MAQTHGLTMARFILVLLVLPLEAQGQRTIYVSQVANGAGDGTSWSGAFAFLQDALAVAQSGDEVWVAEGIYRPDEGSNMVGGDREASFVMPSDVRVFGGFLGTEESSAERQGLAESVLSGDLLSNDVGAPAIANQSKQDNSYRIVRFVDVAPLTEFDGFIVSGAFGARSGGGLDLFRSSPTIRNVVISGNAAGEGAGAYTHGGRPRFVRCTFQENVALFAFTGFLSRGGAIYVDGGTIRIDSTLIARNRADEGGGMYVVGRDEESGAISNTVFLRNRARWGGGVTNRFNTPLYVNVRFLGNYAWNGFGGAVVTNDAEATFVNVEFSGNRGNGFLSPKRAGSPPKEGVPQELWSLARRYSSRIVNGGGAIWNADGGLSLVNATFSGNHSPSGGAAVGNLGTVTVVNSIFGDGEDVISLPGYLKMGYSIYRGALPAGTVITGPIRDADPLFYSGSGLDGFIGTLDDDLTLRPGSPAIGFGTIEALPRDVFDLDGDGDVEEVLPIDIAGHPRIDESSPGQVDVGAHQSQMSVVSVIEGPGETILQPNAIDLQIYPVPFGDRATVRIISPSSGILKVEIFDLSGRRLVSMGRGSVGSGEVVHLDLMTSNLPPGFYYARIAVGLMSVGRAVIKS